MHATFSPNRRRAPAFGEQGERGEEHWLTLELKLVADVAIVGFPNVARGKSTLISAVSAAWPKIARTTRPPPWNSHLGVVTRARGSDRHRDRSSWWPTSRVSSRAPPRAGDSATTLLRHIERARVLVILVDLAATGGIAPAGPARGVLLRTSLGRCQPSTSWRAPGIVVGSKADLVGDLDPEGAASVDLVISAATGAGVGALVRRLAALVLAARAETEEAPGGDRGAPPGGRADRRTPGRPRGVRDRRAGPPSAPSGCRTSPTTRPSTSVLHRLDRLGVDRVLARAGAHDGDEVRVGELSFTWFRYGPEELCSIPKMPEERPPAPVDDARTPCERGSAPGPRRQAGLLLGHRARRPCRRRAHRGHLRRDRGPLRAAPGGRGELRRHRGRDGRRSGRAGRARPTPAILQAVSARWASPRVVGAWIEQLARHGLSGGQVLLAPLDFVHRQQYLHARQTLAHLLDLGGGPDHQRERRRGRTRRSASATTTGSPPSSPTWSGPIAWCSWTDTPGLLTADPRRVAEASLIEEVIEIDQQLEQRAGGPGTAMGSGGMASKLAAAKMATWSGVETVIAEAGRPGVLASVVAGEPGAGTVFRRRARLAARPAKLWIAFALPRRRGPSSSTTALAGPSSRAAAPLLAAIVVVGQQVTFEPEDAVEVVDSGGSAVVSPRGWSGAQVVAGRRMWVGFGAPISFLRRPGPGS